jgi:hypothetical protein
VRRFATCCGVQLCGGASIPRLVCALWPFLAFVSVMCLSASACTKETRVLVFFRPGGFAMGVTPALSTRVIVLLAVGGASVAPTLRVSTKSPRPGARVAGLSSVSHLPVTGRASEGSATPALCSLGHAVV